ncbi:ShlB/FhaC/HecB family hemolysin secretion/activation protein [Halomonas caseinilytica]|uniref:ShlB/FhaC/HecB family hemolysin secretion/activation protein n=1 Tax=Halomonas caseinilytica TaxID=438744 RepID=UPI0008485AA8|nr:ShlB/FhaC/HecB family hemolysin secretion/activation protein [Halomonas caseinilytica]
MLHTKRNNVLGAIGRKVRRPVVVMMAALLFSAVAPAWAQPSVSNAGLYQSRQQDTLKHQRDQLQQIEQSKPFVLDEEESGEPVSRTPSSPVGVKCIPIERIDISGNAALTAKELSEGLKQYEHRCLTPLELDDVRRDVTLQYIGKGFLTTKVYFGEQRLSPRRQNTLKLTVVEGKVEDISSDVLSDSELWTLFPDKSGVLNIRDLEQMQDHLSRLNTIRTSVDVAPGSVLGTSRIDVKGNRAFPLEVGVEYNNDGQKSTGRHRAVWEVSYDSPLGMADKLSLSGEKSLDDLNDEGSLENLGVSYSIPFGWWLLSYTYQTQEAKVPLSVANVLEFENTGKSTFQQLRFDRVVQRDGNGKTSVMGGVNRVESDNFIENIKLDLSSFDLTEAVFGLSRSGYLGNARYYSSLNWAKSINDLGADHENAEQLGDVELSYDRYNMAGSLLYPWFVAENSYITYETLLVAQYSDDLLPNPVKFSAGGSASIRGFRDQLASSSTGVYSRNQASFVHRPQAIAGWVGMIDSAYVGVGYDIGYAKGELYNDDYSGRLSSVSSTMGLKGGGLSLEITYAKSLDHPGGFKDEDPLYFKLGYDI